MISETVHLNIGSLLFKNLDQIDLTGPFEVLSRLPNATHRIYAKSADPVRDMMGLRVTGRDACGGAAAGHRTGPAGSDGG
jgi:cyclohexyl-isocyanide hydratase